VGWDYNSVVVGLLPQGECRVDGTAGEKDYQRALVIESGMESPTKPLLLTSR